LHFLESGRRPVFIGKTARMQPVLVIHGGAGARAKSDLEPIRKSISKILKSAYPLLLKGGSAVEAVTEAVRLLEDDPLFNAGKGSKIQRDGRIRMSAAIMDGHNRKFGGCVNVEGLKNPIQLARLLMKERDRVLAGKGAVNYARSKNMAFASPVTPKALESFKRKQTGKTGTVGAVAIDRKGRMAAATSTGGRGNEYPFRVSDSPTTAGNFANSFAAVSATGIGEQIVEFSVASSLCAFVDAGIPLDRAARKLLKEARSKKAEFGFIALDRKGHVHAGKTTPSLIWGSAFRHEVLIGF